jgi:hypothetical protein
VPHEKKYVLSTTFDGKGKHAALNSTVDDEEETLPEPTSSSTTGWFDFFARTGSMTWKEICLRVSDCEAFLLGTLKFATTGCIRWSGMKAEDLVGTT